MKEQLNKVLHEAKEKLAEAETQADMEEIRVKMLGKKGKITSMLKYMGKLAPEGPPWSGREATPWRSAGAPSASPTPPCSRCRTSLSSS